MDKAEIVKINPLSIEQELKGPVMTGFMEKGWSIQTSIMLEDPRVPPGHPDRMRLGLIMFPPHEGRGQVTIKEGVSAQVGVLLAVALVASALTAAAVLFAGMT